VTREQGGHALGAESLQQRDHGLALLRIETVERLVQNQHLRLVHERLGDLDALTHALGEALHVALGDIRQIHGRQRGACRAGGILDTPQASTGLDHPARGEAAPEPIAIRHDPDRPACRTAASRIEAVDPHRTLVRAGKARGKADGRGLAGAVVSEQSGHAGLEDERDVTHGDRIAKPLRDAVELEQRRHASLRR
jgi:hypothetical protein